VCAALGAIEAFRPDPPRSNPIPLVVLDGNALALSGVVARMRCPIGSLVVIAVAVSASACALPGSPVSPDVVASASSTVSLEVETAYCIDEVNRYRTMAGEPPLARSAQLDAFSTEAARVDGQAHQPHKHFIETNGGPGIARAQNVIPFWKLSSYGSVRRIVREGLALMWAEGPGGGHYDTMRGDFSEMGCGVYVADNGEVTVSQDFH
jgi:hypothetical protein